MLSMGWFWNGLNDMAHRILIGGLVHKVNSFTKAGQVHVLAFLSDPFARTWFTRRR